MSKDSILGLDPKHFKYLKSDKNSTTLQHKNGHTVTIAHNTLSPKSRATLQALATAAQTPIQTDEVRHQQMAKGGSIDYSNYRDPALAQKGHEAIKEKAKRSPEAIARKEEFHRRAEHELKRVGHPGPAKIEMAQGGNAGEQRKKIFGSSSAPAKPEMREKHMEHINQFSQKQFGMPIQPSGGKINLKTGQRRDENPEQGVDKPDWRSGQLESQSNPDAMVHELSHLMLLPKGVSLKEGQKLMDKQYSEVQKKHGYMKQKRSQGEIQPMAAEQILRRHLGLPANQNFVPVKEGEGPRTAVDTKELAGTRIKKGEKVVDLIRQARFLTPENKKRIEEVMSGKIKFHPEHGWQENPEHLGAKSRLYKEEHPNAVKKMAEGGEVSSPADATNVHEFMKSIIHPDYANGGPVPHNMSDNVTGYAEGGETDASIAAKASQKGGVPSDSPISTGDWSHIWKADGGSVNPPDPEEAHAISKWERGETSTPEAQSVVRPTQNSAYGDESWPSPSQTSVGQKHANGGEICKACGGPVQKYADGDIVMSNNIDPTKIDPNAPMPDISKLQLPGQTPLPQGPGIMDTLKEGLSGAGRWLMAPAGSQQSAEAFNPTVTPQAVAATQAKADSDNADQKAVQADLTQRAAEQQAAQTAPPPKKMPGLDTSFASGVQQQIQGTKEAAAAQGQLGQQQASVMAEQANRQQQAMDAFKSSWDELNQERQAHIADIQNGHIDPELYWQGHTDENGNQVGGHSKVASAIGMILAGFNPSNKPNAAIDFLNHQMDLNMDAQKQNLGAKKTLLEANIQQFGNVERGTLATRVMMNDMVANELNRQAALAQSPIAKANAKVASGKIITDTAPMALKLGIMGAVSKLSQGKADPGSIEPLIAQAQTVDPELGKTLSQAYMPGVGVSSTLQPIPEQEKARIQAYQNTLRSINQAINFKKDHPAASWSIGDRAAANTLMLNLSNQVRVAEDMGVWKRSEAEMMNAMLGKSPADFMANWQTNPKLREMAQIKQLEYQTLLKSHNLPAPNGGQTAPQGNIQSVKGKDGRDYQRQIINGKAYMIPVGS